MKRATLQDQYNLISEGQGHKGVFLNDAKRMFPQYILNQSNYEQTVQILKEKNILKENIQVVTGSDKQPDWFKIFEDNIKNIKVESKKVDKEVEELETKGFDYKDPKNLDNQIGQEVLQGLYCELKNDPELELEKAKDKVAKNLTKNPLYYVENGQFGVEGLGYVTEHPGLGEPKEPKGKHKSSGYGDIPKEMKGNVNKSGLINESKKKSKKKSNMKEQKLRKIVRSIIKEEIRDWRGNRQGEMFDEPSQLDMPPAATEAYKVIEKAAKIVWPNDRIFIEKGKANKWWEVSKHQGRGWDPGWMSISSNGTVRLPITLPSQLSRYTTSEPLTQRNLKFLTNLFKINDNYGKYSNSIPSYEGSEYEDSRDLMGFKEHLIDLIGGMNLNIQESKIRRLVRSIIKEEMEGETLLNKANELVATHGDMVPDDLVTYMKDDWNIVISRKEAHELIDQLENSNHPYYSWPEGDYDYEDDPEARYFRNMETNAERFSGYGEDY